MLHSGGVSPPPVCIGTWGHPRGDTYPSILFLTIIILDFMEQGTIMEAEAPTVWVDATPSKLTVPPPPPTPIFTLNALPAATLSIYPGLEQAPNNVGLHSRWLG